MASSPAPGISFLQYLAQETYSGFVATHGFAPHAKTGGNNQIMSCTYHAATDDITSLSIIYPNWYGAENKLGAALNITASVEYPTGNRVQVKFGGVAQGTIADGSNLRSDEVRITIPKGAVFKVRQFLVNPSATGIIYSSYLQNQTLGEAMYMVASGATDMTMSGNIAANYSNTLYGPLAIIGTTRQPSVLVIGDSRTAGANEDHATVSTESGMVTPSLFPSIGFSNVAIPGEQGSNFLSVHTLRAMLGMFSTHIVCNYGINDMVLGGQTGAQVLTTLSSLAAMFPKQKFWPCTILCKSSSTDSWATLGAQTTDATNPQRIIVNTGIRAGLSGATGYFETADAVESARNSGLWKVNGTANAYTSDGLHGSTLAYQGTGGIVASGAINPAVLTR